MSYPPSYEAAQLIPPFTQPQYQPQYQPQPNGFTKNQIMVIGAIILVIFLILIIALYYHNFYNNNNTTAKTSIATTGVNPTQSPSLPAHPEVIKSVTYQKMSGSGVWDGNGRGDYTCPNALGSNQIGDNANFCIFNDLPHLFNYCDNEPSCKGFVTNSSGGYEVTDHLVPNTVANGVYFAKVNISAPAKQYTYKQESGSQWVTDTAYKYTCPNALKVDLSNDYSNYCIFHSAEDAQRQCNKDSKCIGYSTDGNIYQLGTGVTTGANSNQTFYRKT